MRAIIRKEIHLDPSDVKWLVKQAKKLDISLKEFLERIINRHVAEYKEGNAGTSKNYPLTIEECQ